MANLYTRLKIVPSFFLFKISIKIGHLQEYWPKSKRLATKDLTLILLVAQNMSLT